MYFTLYYEDLKRKTFKLSRNAAGITLHWGAILYTLLQWLLEHYVIDSMIFRSNLLNVKCEFYFGYNFVWNIDNSGKNSDSCYYICSSFFMQSNRHYCHTSMKRDTSRQIFEKISQIINFIKIPSSGPELFHTHKQTDGPTDRHEDTNIRLLQFCE
jgi:hypothetical protein